MPYESALRTAEKIEGGKLKAPRETKKYIFWSLRLSKVPSAKVLLKLEFDTEDQVLFIYMIHDIMLSAFIFLIHHNKLLVDIYT